MYLNGRGVPQDDAEAIRWLRLAADHGNTDGQLHLGFVYKSGRGVPQNDMEADRWFNLVEATVGERLRRKLADS